MADEEAVYILTLDKLPYLCILTICEYLSAHEIGRFSRVNKACRDVTRTESLWRNRSLWRWGICNVNQIRGGTNKWLRYFTARIRVESKMDSGRPGRDYRVKSLRKHDSDIISTVCLDGASINWEEPTPPLLVTLSSDFIVHAWNISEGSLLWSITDRPVLCIAGIEGLVAVGDSAGCVSVYSGPSWGQYGPLVNTEGPVVAMSIANIQSENILITSTPNSTSDDGSGIIKLWKIQSLLTNEAAHHIILTTPTVCDTLSVSGGQWLAGIANDSIMVWDIKGCSSSSVVSEPHVTVHDTSVVSTHWLHPGMIITMSGGTGTIPLNPIGPHPWGPHLPGPRPPGFMLRRRFGGWIGGRSQLQFWDVSKHLNDSNIVSSSVYQVSHMYDPTRSISLVSEGLARICYNYILIGAYNGTLSIMDINTGTVLQSFTHHNGPITDIYTDSYRVLTCSKDNSIRVYRWERSETGSVQLVSLYQLLGGSVAHKTHDGFSSVVCSAGSCVGVAGKVVKLYNFTASLTDD